MSFKFETKQVLEAHRDKYAMIDAVQTSTFGQTGPLRLPETARGTRPLIQTAIAAQSPVVTNTRPLVGPAPVQNNGQWDALNALVAGYNDEAASVVPTLPRPRRPRLSASTLLKLKRQIAAKRKTIKRLENEAWRKDLQMKQLRVLLNRLKSALASVTEQQKPALLQRITHVEQAIRRLEVDLGAIGKELSAHQGDLTDLNDALEQGSLPE